MTDIVADPSGASPVAFVLPWRDDRPSICSVIEAGNDARLPDRRDDIFAREVITALEATLRTPSPGNLGRLHLLVADDRVLGDVEPLLARAARTPAMAEPARSALARRLATMSPDRGPVRLGIALLGLSADRRDAEILMTLGRHPVFARAAAVALGRLLPEPERGIARWTLARAHRDYERVDIVRLLAGTDDPAIKGWLLREGFRDVLPEDYLAYDCATAGDLAEALRQGTPDEALLRGAGELICGLIRRPARPRMTDYADGAEAVLLYLGHLASRPAADLEHAEALQEIARYVAAGAWEGEFVRYPWRRSVAATIAETAHALLSDPAWPAAIRAGLEREDSFAAAVRVADGFGIDTWDMRFEKLRAGAWPHHDLFETADPERLERLVGLAVATMAAGGEQSYAGLPDEVLRVLRRFPGRGWPMVAASLTSPFASTRERAVAVLSAWDGASWPEGAKAALDAALAVEPDLHVAANIARVLNGDPAVGRPYHRDVRRSPPLTRRPAPPPAPSPGTP
jgi:hypothetical protein